MTCATDRGPATPRAIGRLGAGACTMASQQVHAIFGCRWWITRKLTGMSSSRSASSSPNVRRASPQAWQASPGGQVIFLVARQKLRNWLARYPLTWCRIDRRHLVLSLGVVGLQALKVQFELLDLLIQLLGLAAELHAPQPVYLHLQIVDLSGARVQLSMMLAPSQTRITAGRPIHRSIRSRTCASTEASARTSIRIRT